ncbi:MAG: lysostaphin resistance A-like protein [Nitrospirales bacterium]|nr:CPBP family intramembrane metalloprotease [Nitrospirales bacterium]
MKRRKAKLPGVTSEQVLLLDKNSRESAPYFAMLPILATAAFYVLPASWQSLPSWQFAPQLIAFVCLGCWARLNTNVIAKLGLEPNKITKGIGNGLWVGILLGGLNTALILFAAPGLGIDIEFLRETPHAHIQPVVMVPWFIVAIAIGVEVNFRGFVLGRLASMFTSSCPRLDGLPGLTPILPLVISSLVFAFDPFLVSTFQHLHWIAVWDGLIWGWLWLKTHNLYIPIAAHGMEVIIEYLTIRAVLI